MNKNNIKENVNAKDYRKGFQSAWLQLRIGEAPEAKETIKEILGIKSEPSFSLYRAGKQIPDADKAAKIIDYFNQKGIYNVYE